MHPVSTRTSGAGILVEMTQVAQRVLDEALRLTSDEQDFLVRELIARLDGEPDPDAANAWMEEIATRAREARAGAPAAGDWQEVCDAIEADILPG